MYRFSSIYIIDRSIQLLLVCAGGIIGVQFLLSKAPTFKSLQTSDNHYATRCMLQWSQIHYRIRLQRGDRRFTSRTSGKSRCSVYICFIRKRRTMSSLILYFFFYYSSLFFLSLLFGVALLSLIESLIFSFYLLKYRSFNHRNNA